MFRFVSPHMYGIYHRPPFSASPNVYVEPIESNKVVKEKNDGGNVLADNMDRLLCFEYKQNESLGKYQSGMMVPYM